MRICW